MKCASRLRQGDGRQTLPFFGVAATTYVIKFDQKFQTGSLTCQARIFPPGVDPFHPEAIPIANSQCTCPGIEFHRIPIAGKNEK